MKSLIIVETQYDMHSQIGAVMGIFIMFNNLFHDFAVALLAACLFVLSYVYRSALGKGSTVNVDFAKELFRKLKKIIIGCWTVIIIGGVIRTLAFEQYEWMEAAGRGQVTALVIKHIVLVSLIVWGTLIQIRLSKQLRKSVS